MISHAMLHCFRLSACRVFGIVLLSRAAVPLGDMIAVHRIYRH